MKTNEQLAIKIFKDSIKKERSLQEVELMSRLSHENVVKVVPIPDDWKSLAPRILCMEFCTEGNLRKLLNQPENCSGLPERLVRRCLKNVKDGLEYIHSQSIVHRDIKPENIVLQRINDDVVFKLIDFGYAVKCDTKNCERLITLAGTSDYFAPEVLLGPEGYKITVTIDYWDFGFICFEIITGHRPFLPHLKAIEWIEKIRFKTEEVICVFEIPYKPVRDIKDDNIVFSTDIPSENHISKTLADELVPWLRLALKIDFQKRGRNRNNELVLFSLMEEILNKKVLSVFISVDCVIHSCIIDESTTALTVKQRISSDRGHSVVDHVVLTPSGTIVDDNSKVIEFWKPSAEIAMLYVVSKDGVTTPFIEPNPPQSVVKMAEQWKEPSAYHCRKKVYSDSIYFIQNQLNMCKAFYRMIEVELSFLLNLLHNLVALEQVLRNDFIRCTAKIQLVQLSIQYNEKCYDAARESKVIIESGEFLKDKKQKMLLLKSQLNNLEKETGILKGKLQDVTKMLQLTRAFDRGRHNIQMLEKFLEKAGRVYKALQQFPKELRQSDGNCSDMLNIMYEFLDAMHSVVDDQKCQEIVKQSNLCKATIKSMYPELQSLIADLKKVDSEVDKVELGLFKAIWGLKKPKPGNDFVKDVASSAVLSSEIGRIQVNSRTSISSVGALSNQSQDEVQRSGGDPSVVPNSRSLHRQFEECLTQFKENFEEILKSYEKNDGSNVRSPF